MPRDCILFTTRAAHPAERNLLRRLGISPILPSRSSPSSFTSAPTSRFVTDHGAKVYSTGVWRPARQWETAGDAFRTCTEPRRLWRLGSRPTTISNTAQWRSCFCESTHGWITCADAIWKGTMSICGRFVAGRTPCVDQETSSRTRNALARKEGRGGASTIVASSTTSDLQGSRPEEMTGGSAGQRRSYDGEECLVLGWSRCRMGPHYKMNNINPGSFFVCFKRSYGQSSSRLPSQ